MKDVELWKDIPLLENYQVSSLVRVRSKDRIICQFGHKRTYQRFCAGKILKPRPQNGGYLVVWLSKEGKISAKTVHRLVAAAFMGESEGREINHKDGDRTNNALSNLEWVTRSENIKHSYRELGHKKRSSKVVCVETGEIYSSIKEAARAIGVKPAAIGHVLAGRNKTEGGRVWQRM